MTTQTAHTQRADHMQRAGLDDEVLDAKPSAAVSGACACRHDTELDDEVLDAKPAAVPTFPCACRHDTALDDEVLDAKPAAAPTVFACLVCRVTELGDEVLDATEPDRMCFLPCRFEAPNALIARR